MSSKGNPKSGSLTPISGQVLSEKGKKKSGNGDMKAVLKAPTVESDKGLDTGKPYSKAVSSKELDQFDDEAKLTDPLKNYKEPSELTEMRSKTGEVDRDGLCHSGFDMKMPLRITEHDDNIKSPSVMELGACSTPDAIAEHLQVNDITVDEQEETPPSDDQGGDNAECEEFEDDGFTGNELNAQTEQHSLEYSCYPQHQEGANQLLSVINLHLHQTLLDKDVEGLVYRMVNGRLICTVKKQALRPDFKSPLKEFKDLIGKQLKHAGESSERDFQRGKSVHYEEPKEKPQESQEVKLYYIFVPGHTGYKNIKVPITKEQALGTPDEKEAKIRYFARILNRMGLYIRYRYTHDIEKCFLES